MQRRSLPDSPTASSMLRRTCCSPGGRISYLEYGDLHGSEVVLCHHGGMVSASDVAPLAAVAADLGIRLVSFDRPGIADSSPLRGRHTADGAADARAVLEHLGIDHVRVLGWSMGGQYALATAAGLPDRVERVAVVAGALPVQLPAVWQELNTVDRILTWLALRHRSALAGIARA